ncbi:MAG: Fur family transcriptional regulator [Chloroflexota bacterium]|nr:transcriptional repressor [Dehalococcoidia bacterium]MDW8254456.1 Fur family transcriptional regulator [Chloroflexota bacterium]
MSRRSEQISRLLNERGYSVTPSRRVVIDSVADRDTIFTANDVVAWVDSVDPSIGRATVFRTLDLLAQIGVLNRVHGDNGCHRYTVCDMGHHHHFVCTQCERVIPFELAGLESEIQRIAEQEHFVLSSHRVELFGLCPACQAGVPSSREPRS